MYRLTIKSTSADPQVFTFKVRKQANTAYAVALAANGVTASPTLDRLSARCTRLSFTNSARTKFITLETVL